MADARSVVNDAGTGHEARERIGQLLRRLAGGGEIRDRTDLRTIHGSDSVATVIGRDDELGARLMLARFSEKAPTPVHDHNSWGVVCVVNGRDRYVHWDRLDDGQQRMHATLRVRFERELGPGDVVSWGGPPDDIHSQQGIGGPAWELVYFGSDPNAVERAYFDPTSGTVRHALPQ